MNLISDIQSIYENIEQLQVVKCGMFHEGVAINPDGTPKYSTMDSVTVFDRLPLCTHELRNVRLGCAHSGVNVKFESTLDKLIALMPHKSEIISSLKTSFSATITKIYTTDHQMGHLEHQLGHCQIDGLMHERAKLEESKALLKEKHDGLMNQLKQLKTDIELFIKNELNKHH
ncbi:hypothetical protein [Formosa sp. Hel1_31_208]|uniref:hypothetical protein n=1 Tax=Formosa sp. Hel1_31_208 TaxID=1798225 RepID=UPI0012FE64C9|nr:hypothetical protein [Formosa sp. Hel1_31_208]